MSTEIFYYAEENEWNWDDERPNEAGWYWQSSPDDGDPHGPFTSEDEAKTGFEAYFQLKLETATQL